MIVLVIPRVIWARIDSSQDYVLQLLKLLVIEYGQFNMLKERKTPSLSD